MKPMPIYNDALHPKPIYSLLGANANYINDFHYNNNTSNH